MTRPPVPLRSLLPCLASFVLLACAAGSSATGDPGDPTPARDPHGPTLRDDAGFVTAPDASAPSPGDASTSPSCAPRPLTSLTTLAKAKTDPCGPWTNRIRGRVGRETVGSFAVWTTSTPSSLALIVGAMHTVGFDEENVAVAARISAPDPESGVLRLYIPAADGSFGPLLRAPAFVLFQPAVPAAQNTNPLSKLLPRNDFYVHLMDSQRIEDQGLAEPLPGPLVSGPVPVYDPDGLLVASPTYASPAPGDLVAYAGYPRTGALAGQAAIGFGRVLTDAEATAAITALTSGGDEEGAVPYDKEAEMLVAGEATVGMSGGGAFDASGRLVGTLVRASTVAVNGTKYIRVVRMSFVAKQLTTLAQGKSSLAPYLPKP